MAGGWKVWAKKKTHLKSESINRVGIS